MIFLVFPTGIFPIYKALNTAATGMAVQEIDVNTISNNIANVNTVGHKRQRAESQDLLYETHIHPGARSANNTTYSVGLQVGSGAKISGIRREFSQGNAIVTNNPYDIMIRGDGFFQVAGPNGDAYYTRDGSFNVNSEGMLVTKRGFPLTPNITLPGNIGSLSVAENGMVEAFVKEQIEPINLGQISVVTFINQNGLLAEGGNLYRETIASGPPVVNIPGENSTGILMQGSLESSNVSIMNEMTALIRAQRAYEMNSKVMTVADQMLQTVNGIR